MSAFRRTYVEGVRFGDSRKRRHVGVGSLQRLRMRSVATAEVDSEDVAAEIGVVPLAASLEFETSSSAMETPHSSHSDTVTSGDEVFESAEPEASITAVSRQRRGEML